MVNQSKLRSNLIRVLLLALLTGIASSKVEAQSAATILGTVTDASGAAIPAAIVQARNIETGASQSTISDSQGRYRLPNLAIGNYDVQSEQVGFQAVVHKAVVLTVGSDIVVDFSLPVGQLTEAIAVEGEVQQVEITSSAISHLVEPAQIRDLPLNGRNFEQLIVLAPGVLTFSNVTKGAFYGAADAFTVAGSRPNGQQMLLDNTDVMTYENRGSGAGILGTSMGVDAIAEFQTLTNTYGAQYGGNGAVVNSVSKSGTNNFHGSAYEFIRNSALDARGFFDGSAPAPFKRNQFGGTLGGRIKKDKMFFFLNYEGLQQRLGETQVNTVLDANARNGYLPVGGVLRCQGLATGATPAEPCVLPAPIQTIMNFYNAHVPLPDTLNTNGTGTFTMVRTQPGSENYLLGRYDWTASAKDSFYARYLWDFADLTEPLPSAGAFDLWPADQRSHNQFYTMEEKHIYSNSLIGTTRFAYMRPLLQLRTLASFPEFHFYPGTGLPDGRITQITGLQAFGPIRQSPLRLMYNKFNSGEDMIWSRGSHTVRFGGSITRNQVGAIQNSPDSGEWTFNSIPLFLQGLADKYFGLQTTTTLTNGKSIPGTDGQHDWRENHYVLYVQNDWKVFPALTLNIGLRYEPTSNPYEIRHKDTHIIPEPAFLGSVSCSPAGTATCSPLGTVITNAFTPVNNVFDKNASLKNLDPRIGFAWDPFRDHKTSIRGGYGIFHATIEARDYEPGYALVPPYSLVNVRGINSSGSIISNGVPFSLLPPVVSTSGISAIQTQQLGWSRFNHRTPYMQQWNVTVQRELFKNTILTASYVGSHGLHFFTARDVNPPVPISNPAFHEGLQFGTATGTTLVENRLVNPFFGPMIIGENISWSKYHSFQGSVARRLTNRWHMQVSYTNSLCYDLGSGSWGLDRGTNMQNPFNPESERGRCAFDLRNNMVFNSIYQLPLSNNKVLSGWQLSGIFNYRSGLPQNVTQGVIRAFDNQGSANRPDYVPTAPGCNGSAVNTDIFAAAVEAGQTKPKWINTNCFVAPRLGELGNTPRNFVTGPDYINLDAALMKSTQATEQLTVQFRAEFFNVMNHTNFNVPNGALFTGGVITGTNQTSTGTTAVSGTAGQINSIVGTARQIQFGLKFVF
jgi:hypothetical protein